MAFGENNIDLPEGENLAPSAEKVNTMAKLLSAEPFHLGAASSNRPAWDRWKDHAVGRYWIDQALQKGPGYTKRLSNELIIESSQSESRTAYDGTNTKVRERLVAMTMAECIEPTGKYLAQIEAEIGAFEGLITWITPAHDFTGLNVSGKSIDIDLGSVQWAQLFTTIDFLLADRLSAETRALIRAEIEKRIFIPYRERIESGKDIYWWVTCNHNWNTVCLNCILVCALYLKEDLHERAWYLALTDDLIEYSNSGFEKSGFYTEGMSYWGYGFGNYVIVSELVRGATNGQINWLKGPLQSKMALYGLRMEVQDGLFPTFADSQFVLTPISWLTHWLNNCIEDDPERNRTTDEEIDPFRDQEKQNILSLMLNMFHTVDGQKAYKLQYGYPCREWFDDVQFLICRPSKDAEVKMAATFKGGHNGVNHNHNDLGTFTVAIDNKHLLCDPGAETYTLRTFSPKRYHGDLLNSFGHPVPVVAGQLQVPARDDYRAGYGSHAYATVREESFSDSLDRVVLDLTKAYEVESLTSLTREFIYDRANRGQIEVIDKVKYTQPESFETALITYADWTLNDDGSVTISDGDRAVKAVVSSADGDLEFSHCMIQASTTPTRLSWKLREPLQQARVKISVHPL